MIDPSKALKIVRSLDFNEAHGWDSSLISMIKVCDAKIVMSLCLIYEKCLILPIPGLLVPTPATKGGGGEGVVCRNPLLSQNPAIFECLRNINVV